MLTVKANRRSRYELRNTHYLDDFELRIRLATNCRSSPLHIVYDYSNDEVVDIVTAYIPQKPWWETPSRRGR